MIRFIRSLTPTGLWVLGRRMLLNITRDGATIDDRAGHENNEEK